LPYREFLTFLQLQNDPGQLGLVPGERFGIAPAFGLADQIVQLGDASSELFVLHHLAAILENLLRDLGENILVSNKNTR